MSRYIVAGGTRAATIRTALAGLIVVLFAGCGGAQEKQSSPNSDFVSKANALCTNFQLQRNALPTPKAVTQYDAIEQFVNGVLTLFPEYLAQAKGLVAQSPDRDKLTKQWISVEESQFIAGKPLYENLRDAARAKNSVDVAKYIAEVQKLPDRTQTVASFLTSYKLDACARLAAS